MVFSSLLFLFRFLPLVLVLYYIAPRPLKNLVLFILSLLFYAWGEPIYVGLMLFSTIVDYSLGRLVNFFKEKNHLKKAKYAVTTSIIINLFLLGFFKYSNLPLPIGISFYTFQTMSYTMDIYRGDAPVQKNIISFGTYVALFPQLIAGPIVQYKTIASQLNKRKESFDLFAEGVQRFITGLGKKVLLANNIGLLWDLISNKPTSELSVLLAWIGAASFAFQIYFDFSGYSDMAIGLGKMFGFNFTENFIYPYESKSITEFWRRWHISLGTWFREYVYIPLGGNRVKLPMQILNISIVWALTGIWHGASVNFLLWGLYFGLILIIEKYILRKFLYEIPTCLQHLYTLFLVLISWIIFAFEDLSLLSKYLKTMLCINESPIINQYTLYIITSYGILFIILIFASTSIPKKIFKNKFHFTFIENIYLLIIFILCIAFLVDASYNPFLYFRF